MRNRTHRVASNVMYVIRNSLLKYPFIMVYSLVVSGVTVLLSVLGAYLPSVVVRGIEEKWQVSDLLLSIVVLAVGAILLQIVLYFVSVLFTVQKSNCRLGFIIALNRCIMECDYQFLEQQSTQMRIDQSADILYSDDDSMGIGAIWVGIRDLILTLLGIITAISILHKLNLGIIFVILVISLLNTFFSHCGDRYVRKHRDLWGVIDKKIDYITEKLIFKEYAKDIRGYHCENWIIERLQNLIAQRCSWYRRVQNNANLLGIIRIMVNMIYDILIMGYVVWCVYAGKIEISECVLYFGITSQLSGFINRGLGAVNLFIKGSNDVDLLRDILDEMSGTDREKGLTKAIGDTPIEIRFEHVSFRYDSEGEDVISDLNLTIRKGEKLAIVGENGAGKTTIVKILTGMYTPTKGTIYFNNIPIGKYDRTEIYQLISAAFQDCVIYPFSIADNVTLGKEGASAESVNKCLQDAGLAKYVTRTGDHLISEANENGTDLSGGEMQKLLIARALFKNGPVLVLDEPTAALDPIAESELYRMYGNFAQNKTCLFISHRLASTRFCDRIIFLKDGRIQEEGTHEQLLAAGKEYAALFEIQSHYYKEGQGAAGV